MKPSELVALTRLRRFERNGTRRRLGRCHDIEDLREAARRRVPRAVFDYVDGGADREIAVAGNEAAFRRYRFTPHALRDVSRVDTVALLFGRPIAMPLAIAPTGYTRMMHPRGELAVARAAGRRQIPYALSTMATTWIEDVARTGHPDLWFQLYMLKDRGRSRELVYRAAAAHYRVLVLTVDTTVSGLRRRDVRNGFTVPPRLTPGTLAGIAARPGYWSRMLRAPAPVFANLGGELRPSNVASSAEMFETALKWEDVAELRRQWTGPLVVKGPLSASDARRAVDAGADGIQLSNHGGRQLDRVVAPIDLLPEVRQAVGEDTCVMVDSGIRNGADLAIALALGADTGLIGRAHLYGLMAGGELGVDYALELLRTEFVRTMRLLGVTSVKELRDPDLVRRAP